jgi:ubiquinone/menaquinone biosynthesis C-methylase UbiE
MDFDQYAQDYRAAVTRAAGVSIDKLAGEKARLLLEILAKWVGNPKQLRVLDIGCGIGLIDEGLERDVAEMCGVDTSLQSLEFARTRAPATRFIHYDGGRLPVEDASFDGVFAVSVLHHVPPPERAAFMAEMMRAIRPNGAAIIIEHNPLNPVTQHIVSRCAFDADAVLLRQRQVAQLLEEAGASVVDRRYLGFSPFRHALIERAERALGWLPLGAQYCVLGIKRSHG